MGRIVSQNKSNLSLTTFSKPKPKALFSLNRKKITPNIKFLIMHDLSKFQFLFSVILYLIILLKEVISNFVEKR